MMVRLVLILIMTVFMCCPVHNVRAMVIESNELVWTSAMIANAVYGGDLNMLTRQWLTGRGWQVLSEHVDNSAAEGRLYLFNVQPTAADNVYFLAFPGTETMKDARLDLRITRVPFAGSTPAEFARAAADLENKSGANPLVHQGFNDYVQTALFSQVMPDTGMTFGEYIAVELKKDPSRKLYITGHSLGGAAATLAAARLSDLGVAPEQLEVITFGAPAVGNESFARHYEHNFQLTRVTMAGDPVNKVLQSLTGGFVQFGQRVEWRSKLSERFPHGMAVYLDEAYRHYVDAGREDDKSILAGAPRVELSVPVYVPQPEFKLSGDIKRDRKYMEQVVGDLLSITCSPQVKGTQDKEFGKVLAKARAAGCSHVLLEKFTGKRIRDEQYNFRMTLEEEIYDVDGNLLHMQSQSTTTRDLTPLEAVGYLYVKGAEDRQRILAGDKKTNTEQNKDSEK
ncbi:MAG: lipase family protein [Selenomonas sp.]|nr:lipase family protein [Selenomonas sp.]